MKRKDTYFQCGNCLNAFTIETRRGRPPKYCDECIRIMPSLAERKRQRAKERVDALTMRLEARGLAISQHPEE